MTVPNQILTVAGTILIIDDTPYNTSLIMESLEGYGYRVLIAEDGEEGLQRVERVQPDLILLDVMMPGLDGFEVCRRLKAQPGTCDIPVIFMTALADSASKVAGFQAGGVDYITKPLQLDELIVRIGTHIKLRAMQKQMEMQNEELQRFRHRLETLVEARTAELIKSNEQLHMTSFALNRVREAAYLIDENARFVYVNDESIRALGYSREELLVMTVMDIDPAWTQAMWKDVWGDLRKQGTLVVETTHRRKDGSVFPIEVRASYFEYFGKSYSLSMARDISERKQAEARLVMMSNALDRVSEAAYLLDENARLVYVNEDACRELGYSREELLSMTVMNIGPGWTVERVAEAWQALPDGESNTFEAEHRRKDGSTFPVEINATRLEHDGKAYGLAMCRDITERKRVENALRESEQRYREIFENVSDSLYLVEVTPDGRFRNLAFNFAFELSTGVEREELIGKEVNRVMEEGNAMEREVARTMVARYQRCVEAGTAIEAESVLDLPSGRRIYYSTMIPLRDESGRIYRILGIARDVTEQKRAEREFRTLAENAPDNICRYDKECRVIYVNPKFQATLAITNSRIIGRTPVEAFPGPRYQEYQACLSRVIATGNPDEIELFWPDAEQGPRYQHIRFVAERDATGEIAGVLAIGRDITELKRTEQEIQALNASLEQRVWERTEELRQQTRYLRTIIDTLPMMIWLKDTESRFVLVNHAMAESCHLTVNAMVGKTDGDLWPHERAETYIAEDREVMETRRRKIIEQLSAHKQGAVWVEIDKVPVLDDDGSVLGTVGVVRNISERKAMEAARETALEEAGRLVQLRSYFMASMSHELRTPLNSILGYAQILLGENGLNQRWKTSLSVILQSGEHLLDLINDILDFSRIEVGKLELNPVEVRLPEFLQTLADIVRIKTEQKQLGFDCDFAPAVPAGIRVDETRLRQVLLNLLGNAVKFTERGWVRLAVSVLAMNMTDATGASSVRLRFEVQDSGIGIETSKLQIIFQPFEQTGDMLQHHGGTGLGLPISQELVRLMGGDIQVSSTLGEGSTFRFDLDVPVVNIQPETMSDSRRIAGYLGPRKRVLVVDDVDENRNLLIDILSRLEFETREAANGRAALALAETWMPELVLMDMIMPDMDGLETVKSLRSLPGLGQTPVIAVSASVFGDDKDDAIAAGINVFLPKPIDMGRLIAQIGILLKLEWIYTSPGTEAVQENNFIDCELPPLEELKILHRLALEGSMRDIVSQTSHLEGLDERYRLFAQRLRTLAQGYQSKAVLDFVKRAIDRN